MRRYIGPVDGDPHANLLLTATLARKVAQVAAALDDSDLCDSHLLYDLLALADRAEERLAAESRLPQPPDESS